MRERGAALLTALLMVSLLSALAAAYSANVRTAISLRGGDVQRRVGYYAAEAGLNVGIGRFTNIFQEHEIPQGSDLQQTVTVGKRTVDVTLAEVGDCAPCEPTRIPQGELFAGLDTIPYRYSVQSKSFLRPGETEAHLAGEFDIHSIPLFQFLAFIKGHLFIMPLPDATLHGRIHTNSDLYLQPNNTLRIEDNQPDVSSVQVTAAGDIYRGGRKYNGTWRCLGGHAYIDKLEDVDPPSPDLDSQELLCAGESPLPDSTLDAWKGSIRSGIAGIDVPPVDEYLDLVRQKADLRIVLNLDLPPGPITFGGPDLCPNGPGNLVSPALFPIEVQGAGAGGKTRALWRFMCERRGALFYTDLANNSPTPPRAVSAAIMGNRNNYTPPFAPGPAGNPNANVYRRVGEDTSGNGILTVADQNAAVCPVGPTPGGPPGPPWWMPPSCGWPNPLPAPGSWFADMDYRRGGFYNHHEQQWMVLLNLNLRALLEWNAVNGAPLFPPNDATNGGLVIFLSVQGPASNAANNNYGVRIFDSADLDMLNTTFPPGAGDPTGVTIVSDQAVVVEGNYNRVDKFPAAIVGDAIWILSQGWETPIAGTPNDLKSVFALLQAPRSVPAGDAPGTGSFSGPDDLGMNAALLFGLGPSTLDPDWYNGGLENFPRFLENWRGKTFNYLGSFVSLGEPQHKRNDWTCGSFSNCNGTGVYKPPVRAYDYDAEFNQVMLLPPLTPRFVYVQQRLYTRIFD